MDTVKLWLYGLISRLLPETRCFGLKVGMLRWCGAKVGDNVRVNSSARIGGNGKLIIGSGVWIGSQSFIYVSGRTEIRIGNNVDIGPCVMLCNGTHKIDLEGERIAGQGNTASVVIGDGCWLCARSTILPGVELQPRTLVAAGAVVTKSNANQRSLLAGVPAREKKLYET